MWIPSCTRRMPGASPRSITACMSLRPTPDFCPRVDRDRPDAADRVALVGEVRPHDAAVDLRDHSPRRGMRDPGTQHRHGRLRRGEVPREPVMVVDRGEGVEDDPGAGSTATSATISAGRSTSAEEYHFPRHGDPSVSCSLEPSMYVKVTLVVHSPLGGHTGGVRK